MLLNHRDEGSGSRIGSKQERKLAERSIPRKSQSHGSKNGVHMAQEDGVEGPGFLLVSSSDSGARE